jgi:hypothetical protein
VTRDQALGHGLSRHSIDRLVESGAWRRLARGLFLITTAVQRRLTTVKKLHRELDERARHRHRALLRDLLSDVEVGAESPIELRYLRDVERPHGLPKGNRQQSRSGLPYQTDVDYKEFSLIVELDGRVDHEGVGRFRDMDRDNRHALVDAVTLRYGSYDLAARHTALCTMASCCSDACRSLRVRLRVGSVVTTQATKASERANSLSECQSNWRSRSTGHWPLADTSKHSSDAGAVALLRRMTCSSPDHNE